MIHYLLEFPPLSYHAIRLTVRQKVNAMVFPFDRVVNVYHYLSHCPYRINPELVDDCCHSNEDIGSFVVFRRGVDR
jgi:hypothetical protein